MLNAINSQYVNLLQESSSLVNEGLLDLIKRSYPEMAPIVAARFHRIESDVLGIRALSLLLVLSTHHLDVLYEDDDVRSRFNALMKRMTTLYMLENITDDFCSLIVAEGETYYPYAAMMSHFYTLLEALIEDRMSLRDTFTALSDFPSLYPEMPPVGKLSELVDVRPDHLLALHLQSVSDILKALKQLDREDAELRPLIEKAYYGLLNRYRVSRMCLEVPQVSIYEALERGKATILTDFHSAFVLLAAASVDALVRSHAIAQFEILETLIDHSSYVHRILNDTGIAGLQPQDAARIFAEYPPTPDMSARDYIKALYTVLSQDECRYFARLIKDAEENEANIVLDSPCDPSLNAADAILQNLILIHGQFITSMTTLDELLPYIEHKFINALIPEFIEFERSMYSQLVSEGGEYIETSKKLLLSTLNNVLSAESPLSFVQVLLAQSL